MLFTSISFLYYFLPALIIIYFITPKKYKNIILLIASLLFYFYGEPKYVFLMIAEIIIAYIGAILIDKYKNQSKNILIITLFIHVLLLIIFKYTDFIIQTINDISNANIKLLNIALPIGISFYTFQIISYIIDVYNGKVNVQKNIIKLATYVSLFPQLVAGPIVRYQTVEKELDNRTHSFNNFAYGIRRFSIGLAKKVLIANALGELCSKASATSEKTIVFFWIFGISYMLQLYFDFSAYSDMAIGLGRIFGFHFPENFNYPYISKSITEFWRRWHISLSTWFKDYIYIPLGGNRDGKYKQIRNILIVWLLTGIWHGANWTFLIWGLLFGVILIIEKIFLNKFMEKLPSFIRRIYVLFIVMILFIIFSSDNMSVALTNIKGLFGMNGEAFVNDYTLHYLKSYLPVLIIALLGSTPFIKILIDKLRKNKYVNSIINILEPILIVVILVVVTSYLIDNSYNPFLYFRF
ncbi:mBOAT family protein [Clostridium sp. CAG:302]|nr:mBOAT family protein [Clostridium sp. CAG:302]